MTAPALPAARSSLIDSRTGAVSVEWYTFFSNMLQAAVDSGLLEAGAMDSILERLTALEGAEGGLVVGPVSVQVLGTLAGGGVTVRLRNDEAAPGSAYYYGTGSTGTKGWFERRLETLADVDVSTPPVAGDALVYDGSAWVPGSVDSAVPFFIPDGGTYTVAANKQALFALPIELEGTASLVIDGALVEVS